MVRDVPPPQCPHPLTRRPPVVRVPEEAAGVTQGPFDYVILCIKALPDVYDIAGVIESVVTPQHTCILINTTHALGVESTIEERFPTNVVLSLVSGAEISQLGQSEFEHRGPTDMWIGPANKNDRIPASIQEDMAQALAMTLSTGQVDCKVSQNIRQQQYERLIGYVYGCTVLGLRALTARFSPIAFHPVSVIFETPNHSALLEKVGVKEMVSDVIDELLRLADSQGCKLPAGFKQKTMDDMTRPSTTDSIMWQDYAAKRPMEVETFLGAPVKLAKDAGLAIPRIETLYTILHHLNVVNRQRPGPPGSVGRAHASREPDGVPGAEGALAERVQADDERHAQRKWQRGGAPEDAVQHGAAAAEGAPAFDVQRSQRFPTPDDERAP